MSGACAVHGAEASVTRCSACAVRMCDVCFRFVLRGQPSCVRCAHEVRTRARRRKSLAVFFGLVAVAGCVLTMSGGEKLMLAGLFGALIGLVVAAELLRSAIVNDPSGDVAKRDDAQPVPGEEVVSSRARQRIARARQLAARLTPSLSGSSTALIVLAAMTFSAICFPTLLRLPRWLELEAVLGAWWAISAVVLSIVLYRGHRVDDDHFFHAPKLPASAKDLLDMPDPGSCDSGCDDGCGGIAAGFAVLLVLVAAFAVAWLIVELALPLTFLAFYTLTLSAIRRAARDAHHCAGHLPRAAGWGLAWSTLYILPLAAIVSAVHYALAHTR